MDGKCAAPGRDHENLNHTRRLLVFRALVRYLRQREFI